jgi:hypothetical protein
VHLRGGSYGTDCTERYLYVEQEEEEMVIPPQNDPDDPNYDRRQHDTGTAATTNEFGSTVHPQLEDQPSTTTDSSSASSSWIRDAGGRVTQAVADGINNNLIAARYGTMAAIGLLAAYGISQTPLFFRYRTVSEIPSRYFPGGGGGGGNSSLRRRMFFGRLPGRMMPGCTENNAAPRSCSSDNSINNSGAAVLCYVRHLSPVERLLSRSWLDTFLKLHPASLAVSSSATSNRPEESITDLLQIQIAAIEYPAVLDQHSKKEYTDAAHFHWFRTCDDDDDA